MNVQSASPKTVTPAASRRGAPLAARGSPAQSCASPALRAQPYCSCPSHPSCSTQEQQRRPSLKCRATTAPAAAPSPSQQHTASEDPLASRLKAWVLEHSKTLPTRLTPVRLSPGGPYGLAAEEPVRRGQVLSGHPLLWGPERLAWLAGSPLAGVLAARQAQVAEDTEVLLVAGANELPLAERHRAATGSELVSASTVGWAAAVLLSRSFSLDLAEEEALEGDMSYFGTWTSHGPDTLALVPWADMLQHCPAAGPESCAAYQFELSAVTLAAHRPYAPGELAADSHGQGLSPADLFLDYGLEDPEAAAATAAGAAVREAPAAGPHADEGEVQEGAVGLLERDRYDVDPSEVVAPRGPRNAVLLRALAGVQGEARLALGPRGPDTATLTYLRAALASDAELVRAGWRVKATERDLDTACRAMGALAAPASAATERALLGALAAFIESAAARFPTSLQHDTQRLAGAGGEPRLDGPERLAVSVLASQKRALAGAAAVVSSWLERLAGGCSVEELYEGDECESWGEEGEEGEGADWGNGSLGSR
ncbi:hypothetical protein GPECTOR_11g337 [Gonium pectorale]|uniref:Rubisco LSMT substrate-binding domain-containing protein n=1 Tax=Gonium pectorale TaxID=33097 RepID=A0A150GQ37_GONPE|nr:hypothetical protein GPECTOR_11g337 [Gonium pectorale]|eukprot:KXZ51903.1 hypothetical protein GPECTOR_11g337 [Gonium pectorale]